MYFKYTRILVNTVSIGE